MQAPEPVIQKLVHLMQSGGQYTPTHRRTTELNADVARDEVQLSRARLMFTAEKRISAIEAHAKVIQVGSFMSTCTLECWKTEIHDSPTICGII